MIAQTMKINESRSNLKSKSYIDGKDITPTANMGARKSLMPKVFLEEKENTQPSELKPALAPNRKKKVTYLGTVISPQSKDPNKILEALKAQVSEIAERSKELQDVQKMLETRVDNLKSSILQSLED